MLLLNRSRNLLCMHTSQMYNKTVWFSSNSNRNYPRLIYFANPITHLMTKLNFKLLRMTWDPEFSEDEFKRGATKAALRMTNLIQSAEIEAMHHITTDNGFRQIYKDTMISMQDPRLSLLQFREKDVKKSCPIKVTFTKKDDVSHLFIDMFFAMLRSVNSMNAASSDKFMSNFTKIEHSIRADGKIKIPEDGEMRKLVLAEIFTRFHRDYSKKPEWKIEFYKVAKLKILYSKY